MAAGSSAGFGGRCGAWRFTGIRVATLALVALSSLSASPTAAGDLASWGSGFFSDGVLAQSAGLPSGGGEIGPVRRDAKGKIVPAEPQGATRWTRDINRIARAADPQLPPNSGILKGEEEAHGAAAPSRQRAPRRRARIGPAVARTSPGPAPYYQRFSEDRVRHSLRAQSQQRQIGRIITEERARKRAGAPVDGQGLTLRERVLVQQLNFQDRAVRQHEMRHFYAGRPHTNFPEYWYVSGPDGRRYVAAGITRFDVSAVANDKTATLEKLRTLYRAALAPADPSPQDRSVAQSITRRIRSLKSR